MLWQQKLRHIGHAGIDLQWADVFAGHLNALFEYPEMPADVNERRALVQWGKALVVPGETGEMRITNGVAMIDSSELDDV